MVIWLCLSLWMAPFSHKNKHQQNSLVSKSYIFWTLPLCGASPSTFFFFPLYLATLAFFSANLTGQIYVSSAATNLMFCMLGMLLCQIFAWLPPSHCSVVIPKLTFTESTYQSLIPHYVHCSSHQYLSLSTVLPYLVLNFLLFEGKEVDVHIRWISLGIIMWNMFL